METPKYDKQQIMQQFHQLLTERKIAETPIAAKQKQLQIEVDQKTLEAAADYTVESIVKGSADLQLDFNSRIDDISDKLSAEVTKLAELRRAIHVATRHLDELRKIRIAAEALNILIQEHEQTSKSFQTESEQKQQALENEITTTTDAWKIEQEEFETANKAHLEKIKKERKKNEADYKYDLERKQKIELDKIEDLKRALERRLADESEKRESDWSEREKMIAGRQDEMKKYQEMVMTFDKELHNSVRKAQAEAIDEAKEKAALEAELSEKEIAANREMYELKIKSLEDMIAKQGKQIEDLNVQLQEAVKQSQDLAFKTLGSAEKITKSKEED